MTAVNPSTPQSRHIFRWVFLAVNVLFLVWLIAGVGSVDTTPPAGANAEAFEAGTAIGAGVGAMMIIFLWVSVDVILGIGYLVFRKK